MLTTDRANPVYDRIPVLFSTASLADLTADQAAYIERMIDAGRGIVFHGPTGRGKSHAMAAMARRVRQLRSIDTPSYDDRWVDWMDLLEDARRAWKMRGEDAHRFDPFLWAARQRDHLFVDDVGAESERDELGPEKFPWLVNERYKGERQLTITTNLSPDEIERRYGTRTLSRLHAMSTFVAMTSTPDRRLS